MKTSKEFFEKLQSDEGFAQEIAEKVKAMAEAGEEDYKKVWIPVAAEYGYELTGEELDELYEKNIKELSDEELGKVSGGVSIFVVASISLTIIWSMATITAYVNGKDKD